MKISYLKYLLTQLRKKYDKDTSFFPSLFAKNWYVTSQADIKKNVCMVVYLEPFPNQRTENLSGTYKNCIRYLWLL
jgi:hypothetical protein